MFLGGTLIEREQKYGYWELALTLKNKDKAVSFRNLGWSGGYGLVREPRQLRRAAGRGSRIPSRW